VERQFRRSHRDPLNHFHLASGFRCGPLSNRQSNSNHNMKLANKRRRLKSNAGFTLTELLIVLVIMGLLGAVYINRNYASVRAPAVQITTESLVTQIESTYGNWVNAGGTHSATAASLAEQSNMAFDILSVLTGTPGVNFVPSNTASTLVLESPALGLPPASNTIRLQLRSTFANSATGVTYGQYHIVFKPTSTTSGLWKIQTTAFTAAQ
jgi:prepilin-type N-terminal cleavage/methylation domain-containing protein